MHLNPDHFLQTPAGRVTTPERNTWAWGQCFAALPEALAGAKLAGSPLYVMVGAQGSGKSAWARKQKLLEPRCAIFDAILVKRSERAPILAAAREHGVPAVAVCMRTPLAVCLARNAARPPDEVVDEQGLRNVFAALEPPTEAEGFSTVLVVGESVDLNP
ncbi:MAG: AAA family ATPase [Rubrivivax sp.]|nr:AAA family ATPase [Rubrivivax sp.]